VALGDFSVLTEVYQFMEKFQENIPQDAIF